MIPDFENITVEEFKKFIQETPYGSHDGKYDFILDKFADHLKAMAKECEKEWEKRNDS